MSRRPLRTLSNRILGFLVSPEHQSEEFRVQFAALARWWIHGSAL